jgi:hypothetical protein
MATLKNPGLVNDGPNASGEIFDFGAIIQLASTATFSPGQVVVRDLTQLVSQYSQIPNNAPATVFVPQADQVVLPTSANGGDVFGVWQGVGYGSAIYTNSTGATQAYSSGTFRRNGVGKVLAGALTGGTAVTIGSTLIVSAANAFATVGTRAIGTAVGRVVAYPINTTIPLGVTTTGSQAVTPAAMTGINVGSVLTIDTGTSQETVSVTAITATTFTANFTLVHGVNAGVQGKTTTVGASVIPVPAAGNNQAVILVDINVTA